MTQYTENLFGLKGKVAVVIGGTGELCGTMAEGLAGAGAEVVLVGRSAKKAETRLEKIRQDGGKAWFAPADVTGGKAVFEKLLKNILEKSGQVDIIINGAGVNSATPFFEISEEELDWIYHVNFKSVFFGCQIFGKYLVDRGQGGNIINVGSMSALVPLSRVFIYSSTKATVHNLSKNLAREWAQAGVRVNLIVPGFFPAEQNRKVLTAERIDNVMRHTPAGRFGEPQELIGATLLLASDKAGSFITGSEMIVDGGFSSMTI